MSITGGIVLFAVFWFLALYMVLPFFVQSQEEAGEVEPGTPVGAPSEPMMKKKLIWATVIAVIAWVIIAAVLEMGLVTMDHIRALTGYKEI
jgi:predicted secreted protein